MGGSRSWARGWTKSPLQGPFQPDAFVTLGIPKWRWEETETTCDVTVVGKPMEKSSLNSGFLYFQLPLSIQTGWVIAGFCLKVGTSLPSLPPQCFALSSPSSIHLSSRIVKNDWQIHFCKAKRRTIVPAENFTEDARIFWKGNDRMERNLFLHLIAVLLHQLQGLELIKNKRRQQRLFCTAHLPPTTKTWASATGIVSCLSCPVLGLSHFSGLWFPFYPQAVFLGQKQWMGLVRTRNSNLPHQGCLRSMGEKPRWGPW